MAATAVWALWTTAEHVGSMARPTTDDNMFITVYDGAVKGWYGDFPTITTHSAANTMLQ